MIKKEVTLAIIIGFALGLLITFGIWTANRSLKQAQLSTLASATPTPSSVPNDTTSPAPSPSTSPQPTSSSLTIISPADEALTNANSIVVTGTTTANSTLIIFDEKADQQVTADSTGKFSATVPLETGFNRIRIVSFDSTGKSDTKTIVVTYTTAKI